MLRENGLIGLICHVLTVPVATTAIPTLSISPPTQPTLTSLPAVTHGVPRIAPIPKKGVLKGRDTRSGCVDKLC